MVVLHPKRLRGPAIGTAAFLTAFLSLWSAAPLTRHENFDRDPSNWEGVNNRNKSFKPKTVTQDFGYSPGTSHAGGQPGEVGGRIRSEEHTSELQSRGLISYAVFCLKK